MNPRMRGPHREPPAPSLPAIALRGRLRHRNQLRRPLATLPAMHTTQSILFVFDDSRCVFPHWKLIKTTVHTALCLWRCIASGPAVICIKLEVLIALNVNSVRYLKRFFSIYLRAPSLTPHSGMTPPLPEHSPRCHRKPCKGLPRGGIPRNDRAPDTRGTQPLRPPLDADYLRLAASTWVYSERGERSR